jgi:hypothetical protein
MRIILFLTVLVFPALQSLAGGNVLDFGPKIPARVLDWNASGKDAVYDRKTLFSYMDGGAEVYLAFDFREVFVRKYADAGENELNLDIYDMGSAAEAFGMFSCDRQDPEAGIGQGSEYGLGLLRFWRGRYFVSITVLGNEGKAEKAVLELGKAVAPLLGPDGELPEMLKLLPPAGLKPEKTGYFHDAVHLNNRYFVASDNILNLDVETECVFAEYESGEANSCRLLVVRYPDAGKAGAALESFCKSFLPGADSEGAALDENKKWTMIEARENLLAIAFEASSKKYAAGLTAATLRPPQ